MTSKPLTTTDQKDLLKELKKYLQKNNSIIEIVKGADPFLENCYISTSSITGIYFPNTEIRYTCKDLNMFYKFVCIGKNWRNEKGIFLQFKDPNVDRGFLDEFIFQPFHPLDDEFFKIKDQLLNDIKEIENSLIMLSSFKQTYKKDGSAFKDYNKNFIFETPEGEKKNPSFCPDRSYSGYLYSIKIYFHGYNFIYCLSSKEIDNKYIYFDLFFTFEKCLQVIRDQKEKQEKRLKNLYNVLKNLEKLYNQAKKLKKFFNDKKDILNTTSCYYLSDFIKKGL